jgi:hypothetical protein
MGSRRRSKHDHASAQRPDEWTVLRFQSFLHRTETRKKPENHGETVIFGLIQKERRGRDSNPRYLAVRRFSRPECDAGECVCYCLTLEELCHSSQVGDTSGCNDGCRCGCNLADSDPLLSLFRRALPVLTEQDRQAIQQVIDSAVARADS